MPYAISPEGFALIQEHEGFRSRPEPLAGDAWVVGHGHVRRHEPGKRVTRNQAAVLLERDLAPVEKLVNAKLKQSLTQSQYDALVSFAFSIGADAFARSKVLRHVNAGEFVLAACAMEAWRKSQSSGALAVSGALVRRRSAEKALLLRDVSCDAAPSAMLRAKLDRTASKAVVKRARRKDPDAASRIAEILMSEPATKALLLAPPSPEGKQEEQIEATHAKPVACHAAAGSPIVRSLPHESQRPEGLGLIVLVGLGLALILLGASLLFDGAGRLSEVVAAASLALPGAAIALSAAVTVRQSATGYEHAGGAPVLRS